MGFTKTETDKYGFFAGISDTIDLEKVKKEDNDRVIELIRQYETLMKEYVKKFGKYSEIDSILRGGKSVNKLSPIAFSADKFFSGIPGLIEMSKKNNDLIVQRNKYALECVNIAERMQAVLDELDYYIDPIRWYYIQLIAVSQSGEKKVLDELSKRLKNALRERQDEDIVSLDDIIFSETPQRYKITLKKTSDDYLDRSAKRKRREDRAKKDFRTIIEETGGNIDNMLRMLEKSDQNTLETITKTAGGDFATLLTHLLAEDIEEICRYRNVGVKLHQKILSPEKTYKIEDLFSAIIENIEYMDIDNLILLTLKRYFEFLLDSKQIGENNDQDAEQGDFEELLEIMVKVSQHMQDKNKDMTIPSYMPAYPESEISKNERRKEQISIPQIKEQLEAIVHSYINGERKSPEEIKAIREGMLKGDLAYDAISSKDYLVTMQFTEDELLEIVSHNIEAVKFFRENDNENENEILSPQVIEKWHLEKNKDKLLSIIAHNAEAQRIFEENRVLSEADIDELKSKEKLISLYIEILKAEEAQEKADSEEAREKVAKCKERFSNFSKIFKALVIDKSQDAEREGIDIYEAYLNMREQQEPNNSEVFNDENEKRMIQDFYFDYDLMTIENLQDFLDMPNIELLKMFATYRMKPEDVRMLIKNNRISYLEDIKPLMSEEDIQELQKVSFAFSVFSHENEEGIIEDLVGNIIGGYAQGEERDDHSSSYSKTNRGTTPNVHTRYNRNIMNPFIKWEAIRAWAHYDPNDVQRTRTYSESTTHDGHIIFYLPEEECYIIEKMFKKSNDPNKKFEFAYKAATYILPKQVFEKNTEDILDSSNRINRPFLSQLREAGEARRVPHTIGQWYNDMCIIFDTHNSKKYTESERSNIEKIGQALKDRTITVFAEEKE